ncbi:MAG TPA: hypothetical protein VHG28_18750 [Longimicrobiaceae bacterium]|nr:hypothetical protein [Longimicrobiaceae bacterium]
MPRWYAAFRIPGRPLPAQLLQQVTAIIQRQQLGRWVPRVCFERGARGEYYFGMAIESETPGEPPRELDPLLSISALSGALRQPGHPRRLQVLSRSELQRMTVDMQVEGYVPVLRAAELQRRPHVDPFGHLDEEPGEERLADERYDRLLAWVSAYGIGSMDTFRSACAAIRVRSPSRFIRSLRLLGHLEQSADGRRWSAAPTTLIGMVAHTERVHVLCGARDEALLAHLAEHSTLMRVVQPDQGPCCIRLIGLSAESIQLLEGVEVIADAAARLATVLPTFEEWKGALVRLRGVVPALFDVRRLEGEAFIPAPFDGQSGFYELWPRTREDRQDPEHPHLVAYYDGDSREWLRGEWYGLRFLASAGHDVPFEYDAASKRVACLRGHRLPEIYERALVLSSGLLPRLENGWLIYDSVEPAVAERVLRRLTPRA